MTVLDTNIVIEYLKEIPEIVQKIDEISNKGEPLAISVITEIEVLAHPKRTDEDIKRFDCWLATIEVMPVDSRLGRSAANFRRKYHLKIADSIVVATAAVFHAELLTRDHGLKHVPFVRVI